MADCRFAFFDFLDYFFKMYKSVFDLPQDYSFFKLPYWFELRNIACGEFNILKNDFKNCILPLHELKIYLETKEVVESCFEEIIIPNLITFINTIEPNLDILCSMKDGSQFFSVAIDKPLYEMYDTSYIGKRILSIQECSHNSLMKTISFDDGENLDLFGNCRILPLMPMLARVVYEPYRVNIVYDEDLTVKYMWEG